MFQKMMAVAFLAGLATVGCMGPNTGIARIPGEELQKDLPGWIAHQETYATALYVNKATGVTVRASVVKDEGKDLAQFGSLLRCRRNEVCPTAGNVKSYIVGYDPTGQDNYLVVCGVAPKGYSGDVAADVDAIWRVTRRHLVTLEAQ